MDLRATNGNYPGGTLIVGKNLNPLVLEVLNKRKQDIINSFQFVKSRRLTQIVNREHLNIPLATVPSREAEKPPKGASPSSETQGQLSGSGEKAGRRFSS